MLELAGHLPQGTCLELTRQVPLTAPQALQAPHAPQAPLAPQALQAPLPAAPVSGGPSLGGAGQLVDSGVARSQLEYMQKLEGRVKELEARLAAAAA